MADNEGFEGMDIADTYDRSSAWVNGVVGDITKQSAAKQVAIGGASGW